MRGVSFAAFVLYPMTINMNWLDNSTVQCVLCPSCEVTVVPHALQARPAPVEAILYSFVLSTCTTSATTLLRLLTAPIQHSDTNTKADPRHTPYPATLHS